jgi:hypothetical protein
MRANGINTGVTQTNKQTNKPSCTSCSASTMGPRARVGGQSVGACNPGPKVRTLHTKPITRRRSLTTHTQAMHVEPYIAAITHQHGSTTITHTTAVWHEVQALAACCDWQLHTEHVHVFCRRKHHLVWVAASIMLRLCPLAKAVS